VPDRAARILVLLTALVAAASAAATDAKPTVDHVPATMSSAGFVITGCCSFKPALSAPGLISAQKAVAIASGKVDRTNWQKPTTLLAKLVGPVTYGFTGKLRTVRNPTAWVVTFTGRNSVPVGLGPGGAAPKMWHDTVVLDAKTGDFIRGFYTA